MIGKLFNLMLVAMTALSVLFLARVSLPGSSGELLVAQPISSSATDPQQYPIVNAIGNKIVKKYQTGSCEQLWQEKAERKNKPKSAQEQEAINILRNDPQMRAVFINKIAAPIADKMVNCGIIP